MKILILGGTQFVGRHSVETLLAAGHDVTVFTRGRSQDALPPQVARLRGDRDDGSAGLAALDGRVWDVCIDISGYTPRQVRASAERLRRIVRRYVYISAVSVYGDPPRGPVRESHALLPPAEENVTEVDGQTYGPLKVACEHIVRECYGERCTVLRPQVIVGPHDQTARYAYWVRRVQRGGPMLAPGDGTDHVQVIDVRDVARFIRTVVERDVSGTFNLSGPRLTWAAFLAMQGSREPVWVDADILKAANLSFVELPLYRPDGGPRSSLMHVSNELAVAAGLALTDPAVTARDVRATCMAADLSDTLSAEREEELLRLARSQ